MKEEEILKDFEKTTSEMLDSLQTFLPGINKLKNLMDSKLTETQKEVIDEFSQKAEGLEISKLTELKEEYLKKINNGV
jgi:phage terminase small subunit